VIVLDSVLLLILLLLALLFISYCLKTDRLQASSVRRCALTWQHETLYQYLCENEEHNLVLVCENKMNEKSLASIHHPIHRQRIFYFSSSSSAMISLL
jgi:hypothetical protein